MESNIGWLLARTSFAWRAIVDRYMADIGLTQSRWIAMLHLYRLGEGCSQSELAADIGIEQPSMLRTLNHLEDAGLIERRACANDARRKTLWFTSAGRELLQEVERMVSKGRQQLLAGISKEHRAILHDCLITILDNADKLNTADKL